MNTNEQKNLAEKICAPYHPAERTALDSLRALDKKVKRPAKVFGWSFGTLAALTMGAGMSLIMTDLGQTIGLAEPLLPGLVIGLVGLGMGILNYPIYQRILSRRRKKFAGQILALNEQIGE